MKEHLCDFLAKQIGYRVIDDYLMRPDGSIVGERQNGSWVTKPTQYEMSNYTLFSGRGLPSLLCDRDLTNPGSQQILRYSL